MVVKRMRGGLVVWVVFVQVGVEPVGFVDSDRLDEAWKQGVSELMTGFCENAGILAGIVSGYVVRRNQ